IGLAARHRLDVRRIEQPDLAGTFEQIEDRLPKLAGALEADMRTAPLGQPVGQPQELAGGRAKRLRLGQARTLRVARQPADDDGPFVYIDARAALKDNPHVLCLRLIQGGSWCPPPTSPPHHRRIRRRGEEAARTSLRAASPLRALTRSSR